MSKEISQTSLLERVRSGIDPKNPLPVCLVKLSRRGDPLPRSRKKSVILPKQEKPLFQRVSEVDLQKPTAG